jgi:hypothetical protein
MRALDDSAATDDGRRCPMSEMPDGWFVNAKARRTEPK